MTLKFKMTLSSQEIKELFVKYKDGDMDARRELIEHNLKLVSYRIFDRFKSFESDKDDLMSIGIIGLIKAVDTYDINKGREFSTYASKCIDNEILMFFRKKKFDSEVSSLDDLIDTGNETTLTFGEMVKSDDDIEDDYIDRDIVNNNYRVINFALEQLTYLDKECVKLYFGFYDGIRYKQKNIAFKLNIYRSYVSRVISRATEKIRNIINYEDGYISIIDDSDNMKEVDVVKGNNLLDKDDDFDINNLSKLVNTSLFEQFMNDVVSIFEVNMLVNLLNIKDYLDSDFPFNKVEVSLMLRKILFIYKERLNMYMYDVDKILCGEYKLSKVKK